MCLTFAPLHVHDMGENHTKCIMTLHHKLFSAQNCFVNTYRYSKNIKLSLIVCLSCTTWLLDKLLIIIIIVIISVVIITITIIFL